MQVKTGIRRLAPLAAALCCGALTAPAHAEGESFLQKTLDTPDWLIISASHRTRFEVLHKPDALLRWSAPFFPYLPDEVTPPAFSQTSGLVSLQTSVFVEADFSRVRIGAELMDSRAYLPIHNPCRVFCPIRNVITDAVEPLQAYLAFDLGGDDELMLGRFTMDIGSGRLISRSPFRNNIQSFYGVKRDVSTLTLRRLFNSIQVAFDG